MKNETGSKKPNATDKTGLSGYAPFLAAVKNRIRAAQVKATLSANSELIHLYWDVGRAIDAMQKKEGWGAGVIPRLARDIANDLPEVKGFSERNLKYMIRFAREYGLRPIVQQAVAQLPDPEKVQMAAVPVILDAVLPEPAAKSAVPDDLTKVQQLVAQLPWGQNVILLDKVKDLHARLWYMRQTIEFGWSRSILALQIDSRAYDRRGKAVHNFQATLPPPQSALAEQVLKDLPGQKPHHCRIRAQGREKGDRRVRIPTHPRAAQGIPLQPAHRRADGNRTRPSHRAKASSETEAAMSAGIRNAVAPVVNRLYRRLVIGRSAIVQTRWANRTAGGLPIRDTADCQSAVRGKGVQK